jgi:hypothetical protein
MSKTRLRIIYKKVKPYIICDTNVWYEMSAGKFKKQEKYDLIPTSFSLVEIATSQAMVEELKFYQDTIKMIYENSGPIIPENPFDYILQNQYDDYETSKEVVSKILVDFGKIMEREIKSDDVVEEKLKQKIIEECQQHRGISQELADISNDDVFAIRKKINLGLGKKKHLKIETTEINQEMFKAILNNYVIGKKYSIDWEKFDWSKIELFMIVTEIYFKKLETTKGMKIKANDFVDWFNLLYVTPDDKYLTFDDRWKNFILNDERIVQYLFQ